MFGKKKHRHHNSKTKANNERVTPAMYAKNVLESAKYVAVETAKGVNPTITSFISDNVSAVKDVYDSIKDYKGTLKKVFDENIGEENYNAVKDIGTNIFSDLKSGKFYNKDREAESINKFAESMGMGSFGFDDDFFNDDDDSGPSITTGDDDDDDSISDVTDAIHGMGDQVSYSQMIAGQQISSKITGASNRNARNSMINNTVLVNSLNSSLSGINRTIAGMHEDLVGPLNSHIQNSTTFYETATSELAKHTSYLENISNILTQRFSPNNNSSSRNEYDWESIMGGSLPDFQKWVKSAKSKAFEETGADLFADLLSPEMIKMILATGIHSPIAIAATMILTSKLQNGPTGKALDRTVDIFKNGMMKIVGKIHNTAEHDFGLLGMLARIFDITPDIGKTSLKFNSYNKGKADWDSRDSKALRDVIPTYLANIEAILSGKPAKIFNYNTGKFVNADSRIVKSFKEARASAIGYGSSNLRDEIIQDFIDEDNKLHKDDKNHIEYNSSSRAVRNLSDDYNKLASLLTLSNIDMGSFTSASEMIRILKQRKWISDDPSKGLISTKSAQRIAKFIFKNNSTVGILNNVVYSGKIANKRFSDTAVESDPMFAAVANGSGLMNANKLHNNIKGDIAGMLDDHGNNIFFYLQDYYSQIRMLVDHASASNFNIGAIKDIISNRGGKRKNKRRHNTSSRDGREDRPTSSRGSIAPAEGDAGPDPYEVPNNIAPVIQNNQNVKHPTDYEDPNDPEGRMEYNFKTGKYEKVKETKSRGFKLFKKKKVEESSVLSVIIDKVNSILDNVLFGDFADKLKAKVEAEGGLFGYLSTLPAKIGDTLQHLPDKMAELWKKFKESEFGSKVVSSGKDIISSFVKDTKQYAERKAKGTFNYIFKGTRFDKSNKNNPPEAEQSGSYKGGQVTKSGMVSVSEGELIIPAKYNPMYKGSLTDKQREQLEHRNYKTWRDNGGGTGKFLGFFAKGGTVDSGPSDQVMKKILEGFKKGTSVEDIAAETGEDIKTIRELKIDYDNDKANESIEGIKRAYNKIKNTVKKVAGAAAEKVGDSYLGTLGSAEVDKAKQKVLQVKDHVDYLFGDSELYNNSKVIGNEIIRAAKQDFPKVFASGALGALAGAALTGSGVGLLGGMVIGAGSAILKNSDGISEALFGTLGADGEYSGGLLSPKVAKFVKEQLPESAKGGALGAVLGTLGLAPGGVMGGFVIGAGLELVSTTDTFKDIMFGPAGIKGERNGGIAGALKLRVIDPLIEFTEGGLTKIRDFFNKNVFDPLKKLFNPLTDYIKGKAKDIVNNVVDKTKDVIKYTIGEKFDILFKPIVGLTSKVAKGVGKVALGVATAPFKLAGHLGDKLERHNINKGYSRLSADQRQKIREENAGKRKHFFGLIGGKRVRDSVLDDWELSFDVGNRNKLIKQASGYLNSPTELKAKKHNIRQNMRNQIVGSMVNGGLDKRESVKELNRLMNSIEGNDYSKVLQYIDSVDNIGDEEKTQLKELVINNQKEITSIDDNIANFAANKDKFFKDHGLDLSKMSKKEQRRIRNQLGVDAGNVLAKEAAEQRKAMEDARCKDALQRKADQDALDNPLDATRNDLLSKINDAVAKIVDSINKHNVAGEPEPEIPIPSEEETKLPKKERRKKKRLNRQEENKRRKEKKKQGKNSTEESNQEDSELPIDNLEQEIEEEVEETINEPEPIIDDSPTVTGILKNKVIGLKNAGLGLAKHGIYKLGQLKDKFKIDPEDVKRFKAIGSEKTNIARHIIVGTNDAIGRGIVSGAHGVINTLDTLNHTIPGAISGIKENSGNFVANAAAVTSDTISRILNLYKNGIGPNVIAKRMLVPLATVREIIKNNRTKDATFKEITGENEKENNSSNNNDGFVESEDGTITQPDSDGNPIQYKKNSKGELVINLADAATKAAYTAKTKFNTLREKFFSMFVTGGILGKIKELFGGNKKDGEEKKESLFSKLLSIPSTIGSIFSSVGSGILEKVTGFFGSGLMSTIGTAVKGIGTELIKNFPSILSSALVILGLKTAGEKTAGTDYDSSMRSDIDPETRKQEIANMNLYQKSMQGLDAAEIALKGKKMTTYSSSDHVTEFTSSRFTKRLASNALMSFNPSVAKAGVVVGNAISKIPVVGNVVGKAISTTSNASGIISKAGKVLSGGYKAVIKEGAEKATNSEQTLEAVSKISGKILGTIKSILKAVASRIPLIGSHIDDIAESLSTLIGKAAAKAGNIINKVTPIIYTAQIVLAVEDGLEDARAMSILGIIEKPTLFQRCIAAICNGINYAIPGIGGIINTSDIFNIVCNVLSKFGDLGGLATQRAEAKAAVEQYNSDNGTTYDVEEYIYNVLGYSTTQDKVKSWAKNGIKNTIESIKENGIVDTAKNIGSNIVTGAKNLGTKIANSKVGTKITSIAKNVKTSVGNGVDYVKDAISAYNNMRDNLMNTFNNDDTKFSDLLKVHVEMDDSNPLTGVTKAIGEVSKVIMLPKIFMSAVGKSIYNKLLKPFGDKLLQTGSNTLDTVTANGKTMLDGDIVALWKNDADTEGQEDSLFRYIPKIANNFSKMSLTLPTLLIGAAKGAWEILCNIGNGIKSAANIVGNSYTSAKEYCNNGDIIGLWTKTNGDAGSESDSTLSLGSVFSMVADNTMKMAMTGPTLGAFIGNKISDLFTNIKDAIPDISEMISTLWEYTDTEKHKKMDDFDSVIDSYKNSGDGVFNLIGNGIATLTGGIMRLIVGFIRPIGGIASAISSGLDAAGGFINNALTGAKNFINGDNSSGSGSGIHTTQKGNYDKFGNSTIDEDGCGPAAASTVLKAWGRESNIKDAAKYAENNGYVAGSSKIEKGTEASYFGDYLGKNGISTKYTNNQNEISRAVASGNPTVLLGQDITNNSKTNSPFGSNSHYVVSRGVDKNGNIIVDDPELKGTAIYNKNILKNVKLGMVTGGASSISDITSTAINAGINTMINSSSSNGSSILKYIFGNNSYSSNYSSSYDNSTVITGNSPFPMMTSIPGSSDPYISYYNTSANNGQSTCIVGKPTNSTCNVLSNCVGWANARFNHIYSLLSGDKTMKYKGFHSDAGKMFELASQYSLQTGQTPQAGAIMVWGKNGGAGHVAIVEKVVSSTEVVTSESGYNSYVFKNKTRKKSDNNGNWGGSSAYYFKGFVYNPAVQAYYSSNNSSGNVTSVTSSGNLSDNAKKVWKRLRSKGLTENATAGLMGCWKIESGFNPINLENKFESKYGSDSEYTKQVDSTGKWPDSASDAVGYGLAQWTGANGSSSGERKYNLLNYARNRGKSVGDLDTQVDFAYDEITGTYQDKYKTYDEFMKASSPAQAAAVALGRYEMPGWGVEGAKKKSAYYPGRKNAAEEIYNAYHGTGSALARLVNEAKASESARGSGTKKSIPVSYDFSKPKHHTPIKTRTSTISRGSGSTIQETSVDIDSSASTEDKLTAILEYLKTIANNTSYTSTLPAIQSILSGIIGSMGSITQLASSSASGDSSNISQIRSNIEQELSAMRSKMEALASTP